MEHSQPNSDEMLLINHGEQTGQILSNSAIIEEWRRKSASLESRADDSLITLFDKAFETMSIVLSQPYPAALHDVDVARETLEQQDLEKTDVVRNLLYGFVQTLHITINQLLEDRNDLKMAIESCTRTEDSNSSSVDLPLIAEHESDARVPLGNIEEPCMETNDDSCNHINEIEEVKYGMKMEGRTTKERTVLVNPSVITGRNTLVCSSCEYETSSTHAFIDHLKKRHEKTMREAGLLFKCACGKEVQSRSRVCSCPNARITIVNASHAVIPQKVEVRNTGHSTIRNRTSLLPHSVTPQRSRRIRKSPFRINISGSNSQSYKELIG